MREQIELAEVLDALAFDIVSNVHKVMPGVVVAYHAGVAGKSPATIDVQPAVNDVRIDTELGARISEPWPVLLRIPLGMPRGGGAAMSWPLARNDKVVLFGFDLDPTKHRSTGQKSDPIDTRRHGGGYWVAWPIDITDAGALADPGSDFVLLEPTGGLIILGRGASDFVAMAQKTDANFKALTDFLKVIFPSAVTTAMTDSVTSAPIAVVGATIPSCPSVAATILKAK